MQQPSRPSLRTQTARTFYRAVASAPVIFALGGTTAGFIGTIAVGREFLRPDYAQQDSAASRAASAQFRSAFTSAVKDYHREADNAATPAAQTSAASRFDEKLSGIAYRITLDPSMSEKAVHDLTRGFLDNPTLNYKQYPNSGGSFYKLSTDAAYLFETRAKMPHAHSAQDAPAILEKMDSAANVRVMSLMTSWMAITFFCAMAAAMARHKDGQHRQQERNETFADRKREVEGLITPKRGNAPKP